MAGPNSEEGEEKRGRGPHSTCSKGHPGPTVGSLTYYQQINKAGAEGQVYRSWMASPFATATYAAGAAAGSSTGSPFQPKPSDSFVGSEAYRMMLNPPTYDAATAFETVLGGPPIAPN